LSVQRPCWWLNLPPSWLIGCLANGSLTSNDAFCLSLAAQKICEAVVVDIDAMATLEKCLPLMEVIFNFFMLLGITFLMMLWLMVKDLLYFLMLGRFSMGAV